MGRPLYTNNAATYLAFGITNTATTMQVSANAGSLFPNPTGGDYFYVSLISLSGPIIEIVKCTARSGDIFTIERGQEGTSALYWNMGDNVQLRITAAGMNYIAGSTASTTLEQSFTATQGQTVFTLTNFDYAPGTNNLAVFVNGSKQVSGTNYTETNVNTVTFTTGLNVGDVVEFLSNLSVAAGTIYATDINYNEGATGAVTRTLESKLQESVSVADFGAVGDGVTDDTTAIQNALNAVGYGGIVYLSNKRYYVTGLTIPQYVTLQGTWNSPGYDGLAGSASFSNMRSVLLVNPSGTIAMTQATSLRNLVVFNNDIASGTLPINGSSTFSGTGITMGHLSGSQQCPDMTVENVMILGFTLGIDALRCINSKIRHVNIDCNNGILMDTGGNPIDIQWVLGWPFLSVGYLPYTPAQIVRSGYGIKLQNNMDASRIEFCTFYDYTNGYVIDGCNGVSLISCGADAPDVGAASNGLIIQGACGITQIVGCQFVAQNTGIAINTTDANNTVAITNTYFVANTATDINIIKGSAIVGGQSFFQSSCTNSINIATASGQLMVSDCRVAKATGTFVLAYSNLNVFLGSGIVFENDAVLATLNSVNANQILASANSLSLPANRNLFEISGTTNIFGFTNGWNGRVVTLLFEGVVTLSNSSGLLLNNNANFTTQANSTLTLIATSPTTWVEVSRKI